MPTRHHLLAELEEKRRKDLQEPVEVLRWDLFDDLEPGEAGYDPYDKPVADAKPPAGRAPAIGKRRRR